MKKLFIVLTVGLVAVACNQSTQESETTSKDQTTSATDTAMKNAYQANLATYKAQVAAFEKEDLDAWAATVADSAVWSSPIYGDTITSKAHWVASTKYDFDNFSNLQLTHAQFLPGVDSATQKPDGSVRYYGVWTGTYSSGKPVSLKFYGTYDFNKDHKIISGADYYDAGGMMNALKQ